MDSYRTAMSSMDARAMLDIWYYQLTMTQAQSAAFDRLCLLVTRGASDDYLLATLRGLVEARDRWRGPAQ